MKIKHELCKTVGLGIGLTAIAALLMAGCGGGGGGGGGGGNSGGGGGTPGTSITVTPALGQFDTGATVRVTDMSSGSVVTGKVDTNGVATITIPAGAAAPLLVEAGINGDKYFDENPAAAGRDATTGLVAISGVANTALRALVPSTATTAVGVTPLTEIAVGLLVNANGTLPATITSASIRGANAAVGQAYGVSDPLLPPTPINASKKIATATVGSADEYALKLSALAHMATAGKNALNVTQALRDDENGSDSNHTKFAGTIKGGGAGGVAATITAMNAAMSSAATAVAAGAVKTTAQGLVVPTPPLTDMAQARQTYEQIAQSHQDAQAAIKASDADKKTAIEAAVKNAATAIAGGATPAAAVAAAKQAAQNAVAAATTTTAGSASGTASGSSATGASTTTTSGSSGGTSTAVPAACTWKTKYTVDAACTILTGRYDCPQIATRVCE